MIKRLSKILTTKQLAMKKEDKRAQIHAVYFLPINDADIDDYIGYPSIAISGKWLDIGISRSEFKETQQVNGVMTQQELNIVISDSSEEKEISLRELIMSEVIIRLDYTNGIRKIVGTNRCPVILSIERSGSPSFITISTKRSSPEPAKILRSF